MQRKKTLIGTLVLGLLLLVGVIGLSQAQSPPGEEGEIGAAARVYESIPIQGRLTDAAGNPLNGTYRIRFDLYETASGGTSLCADINLVVVENGLFYSEIVGDCGTDDVNGRQLYLGIKVEDDPEMTPRQAIYSVPYAYSLMPGANISASLSSNAILDIENWALSGRGLRSLAMNQTGTNFGVVGASGSPDGYGGYFYNTSESPNTGFAVAGLHPGYGVADLGSWAHPAAYFGGRIGVIALTKDTGGTAILALINDATGWAGMFTGAGNGVRISVPAGKVGLEVIGGSKNAVVDTDDGARLLYTEESTEVWFTDYGFGQLEDGLAVIAIDPTFAQTINLEEPYHVFVQVYGDAEIYVTNRTAAGFEVHLRDGDPDAEFSYRIVGKRLGYEDNRLERAPWDDDLVSGP